MSNARALDEARHLVRLVRSDEPTHYCESIGLAIDRLADELEAATTLADLRDLVRISVEEAVEDGYMAETRYPEDHLTEIADGCVPVYHSEYLDVLANDPDEVMDAMAEARDEFGADYVGGDLMKWIAVGLYLLLQRHAHQVWRELEDTEAEPEAV